jgi:3-oxoacyl-[acyl-carrier-protein] synthase-3
MKCKIDNVKIQAIATYLPENVLEMSSLKESFGAANVDMIIKATGVERVHFAAEHETSSDMCFWAAKYLIEQEKVNKDEIDGLVFISQTSDYISPATSVILQDRLGLSRDTVCFDISYGCSGYIYGIFQASILISSGACNKVLVLAGDTTTKLINKRDRAQRMVFGDAGSATIVTKGIGQIGFHIGSDGHEHGKVIIPAGGFRIPSSEETKIEYVDSEGNQRSQENFYMDGLSVFNFILKEGRQSIISLLEYMQWNKNEVKLFALHQATKFTLDNLKKRLKIDDLVAPSNIQNYGNTGPATIPLVLTDIYNMDSNQDLKNLDKVVMSGYGVGLSWGSLTCSLQETKIYKPLKK